MRIHVKQVANVAGFGLLLAAGGCSLFEVHAFSVEYAEALNSHTRVELSQDTRHNMLLRGPDFNSAQLFLSIIQDDPLEAVYQVGRLEGRSSERPRFQFGRLEGRTNSTGERLWIIDRDSQRVIASLDRQTKTATGFRDEPPSWAKLDGGIPFGTAAPPAPQGKGREGPR